jgi:hypothetical protein
VTARYAILPATWFASSNCDEPWLTSSLPKNGWQ